MPEFIDGLRILHNLGIALDHARGLPLRGIPGVPVGMDPLDWVIGELASAERTVCAVIGRAYYEEEKLDISDMKTEWAKEKALEAGDEKGIKS